MKFGVIVKGGRAFSVKAEDEEMARKVAETCLFKEEEIREIVELEARENEEIKEEKAAGKADEKGSGEAGEGEKAQEARNIPPDPRTPIDGGVDEPAKAK